jgi:hypothetical protein
MFAHPRRRHPSQILIDRHDQRRKSPRRAELDLGQQSRQSLPQITRHGTTLTAKLLQK